MFDQYLDKYRQICPLSEQQYHFSSKYNYIYKYIFYIVLLYIIILTS